LKSEQLSSIVTKPPRVTFRNSKTLRDYLVRSKLSSSNQEEKGVFKCGRSNCQVCPLFKLGNVFESTNSRETYVINFKFGCNSENVIYLLTCKVCQKQYVGSTITKFRLRLNQYKSNLRLYAEIYYSYLFANTFTKESTQAVTTT